MPTRNVVLTDRNEAMIETLVASGKYQNASEVLREGLRLVEQREAENAAKLESLRAAAQVGLDAIERDDVKRFGDADSLVSHLNALGDAAIARVKGD